MATYTVVSTASNAGDAVHNHPDVGAGLGIGVYQTAGYASMAALQTALVGSAWTEIGPEHSSDVVCNSSGDVFFNFLVSQLSLAASLCALCAQRGADGEAALDFEK